MTKEEFLENVNFGRYPKYEIADIHEGKPDKDTTAIVCLAENVDKEKHTYEWLGGIRKYVPERTFYKNPNKTLEEIGWVKGTSGIPTRFNIADYQG